MNRRQEILDFLAAGMTESEIFRRLRVDGLQASKPTFHRAIKHLMAEQQPAALPVPVSKAQTSKISDKKPDQPSTLPAPLPSGEKGERASSRSSLDTERFSLADPGADSSKHWG